MRLLSQKDVLRVSYSRSEINALQLQEDDVVTAIVKADKQKADVDKKRADMVLFE